MFHNQCSNCKHFYGSNAINIVNSRETFVDLNISDICPHCHSTNSYNIRGTFSFDDKGNWSRIHDFLKDKTPSDIRNLIEESKSLNILDNASIEMYADYLQRFDPRIYSFFLSFYSKDKVGISVIVFLVILMGYIYLSKNDDATVRNPVAVDKIERLK